MKWILPLLLLGLAAPQAAAQSPQLSALKAHNVDQPIDITADRVEVQERANTVIFEGAVKVLQGDMQLTSNRLRVYYEHDKAADTLTIKRLDANGAVSLRSPSEQVDGDWGIYDVERRIVTVGGDVRLRRGDTRINGDRLELNLVSGLTKLDGAPGADNGRVQGRFTVPKKTDG